MDVECAYETKYYVIDKVNGQINAIHDNSLELPEFKGCFSPFDKYWNQALHQWISTLW